ncbi:hypothetical protein JCM10207_006511 [Rhodosporidiobolus poonsookiae]
MAPPLSSLAAATGDAPLASPSKRAFRSSPTSSPDPSSGADSISSPRVLRTRLSNVEDEIRLIFRKEDLVVLSESVEACTTPSTPPESSPEPLVGLGVELGGDEARKSAQVERTEGDQDGSTQTATAERQTQDLLAMPTDMHVALAKLCSQHWASEYNTLKRAVAAAAVETAYQAPLPAPPSYPPLPRVPSFPPSHAHSLAAPSAPSRPQSVSRSTSTSSVREARPAQATPAKKPTPSSSSTLTPALSSFAFTPSSPIAPPVPTPAQNVTGLLADLVEGEPIVVQKTAQQVVVSEAVPAQNSSRPLLADAPIAPPNVPGLLPGMIVVNGCAVKTSVSHPINISPLVPPELLPHLSSRIFNHTSLSSGPPMMAVSSAVKVKPAPLSSFILDSSSSTDLLSLTTSTLASYSLPHSASAAPALGNFVLSSCPGKKVRMNGEPIRGGRGAICRDVLLDLQRAKDECNVALVVCCLDDTELAYLGVPWPEYSAAAAQLGLAVVRLPMVEGFAPDSPEMLDGHLARIVQDYTLKGKSALSHCRGGIGRAGLVASCWMLKMGLVSTDVPFAREEPMRIVERVVELIRKRRSVKAIETAHQVHFLLQYVTYLQQQATSIAAVDLVGPPATTA